MPNYLFKNLFFSIILGQFYHPDMFYFISPQKYPNELISEIKKWIPVDLILMYFQEM